MIKPRKLGHLVLRVRDIQRSEEFYTKILGLEVKGRARGTMVFFRSNHEVDHDLAIAQIGADAPGPEPDRVGLYHMAWELADIEELKDAYQVVVDNGVGIAGYGDHGDIKGLYILDPDGIEIELYAEAPECQNTPLKEILTGGTREGAAAG